MKKKSGLTFIEKAIVLVPEFELVVRKLEQQVTLRGQSISTLQNYIRRIAFLVTGVIPHFAVQVARKYEQAARLFIFQLYRQVSPRHPNYFFGS